MSHKQELSSSKNDGQNSVVRTETSSSTNEITNTHAAANDARNEEHCRQDSTSTENPQDCEQGFDPRLLRCEVANSVAGDLTGERAIPCGAPARVLCEYCGPMCVSCAEETFCFQGPHKLTQLPDDGPLPGSRRLKGPIRDVVYVELKCPNCKRVRLALPKKHQPKRIRKCPVCKAKCPAEYLAHGFTRRRLPYHEVFAVEERMMEENELKLRMPWDHRPNRWVED